MGQKRNFENETAQAIKMDIRKIHFDDLMIRLIWTVFFLSFLSIWFEYEKLP